MATLAELQAQLAQANATTQRLGNTQIHGSGAAMDANQAQMMASQAAAQRISQQMQQMQNTSAAANDPVQKAKDEMYGLARGAVSKQNPIDQMLLQSMQERAGKDAGPYDQTTRDALMTQASDAASQAMRNSKARISGSAGDPSVMAANNEADARRSQAIQQAQLGINTQANVANYDARGQALGQLGNYNQRVQGNQTDNERYLMGLLQQESAYQPDGGQVTNGIPSFAQYSQGATQPKAASTPWQGFTNGGTYSQTPGYVAPHATVAPTTAPAQQPYTAPAANNGTMTGSAGTYANGQFIPTGSSLVKTVAPTTSLRA